MAKCEGCGKKIVWGITPEGKKIPLDAIAPIYFQTDPEGPGGMPVARDRDRYVTHFATCSKANQFSGSNRK